MMQKTFTSLCVLLLIIQSSLGQGQLRKDILEIVNSVHADVGVAIKHLEKGDTIDLNGSAHFPTQSVYKFHLALAVMDRVDKGKLSLDQKVFVRKEEIILNTVSPIARKYPDGNIDLSIRELLTYTVCQSDNNGCDILFRLIGGPKEVNLFIREHGINDISILYTEEEMQKGWNRQFENWTTPKAAVQVLERFYQEKIISKTSTGFLKQLLETTTTGPKRIKGLLPAGTVVAHRTGTGSLNDEGVLGAINNIGVVTLPDGSHFAIAFFMTRTKDPIPKLEEAMAKISRLTYDHFSKEQ